jgi:hypothetical protein
LTSGSTDLNFLGACSLLLNYFHVVSVLAVFKINAVVVSVVVVFVGYTKTIEANCWVGRYLRQSNRVIWAFTFASVPEDHVDLTTERAGAVRYRWMLVTEQ